MVAALVTARVAADPLRLAGMDGTSCRRREDAEVTMTQQDGSPAVHRAVVAVDGTSGSGKSSVSRGAATVLGLRYLDTGAMYRAATWWMLDQGVDVDDEGAVAARADDFAVDVTTDPAGPRIRVSGHDVTQAVREPRISAAVSAVSAVPRVRHRLLEEQRTQVAAALAAGTGIVVEGRDIGTVVLPDADVKIYLVADPVVRAQRRAAEDAGRAHGSEGTPATLEALVARDAKDSTRAVSPLRKAADAVEVDATYLDLPGVIDVVVHHIRAAFEDQPQVRA